MQDWESEAIVSFMDLPYLPKWEEMERINYVGKLPNIEFSKFKIFLQYVKFQWGLVFPLEKHLEANGSNKKGNLSMDNGFGENHYHG